jgi:hypothetical protein
VLTAQHYDLFNSISTDPGYGHPEIGLYEAQAEGAYVRFFEQAFEWDQLSKCVSSIHHTRTGAHAMFLSIVYITYPDFWGRQGTWITKLSVNDSDPVFDEFLKSGFACGRTCKTKL